MSRTNTRSGSDRERRETNSRFYDALWTDARLIEPERFNTWPLVDSLVAHAVGAGATLKKQPQNVFWGGYSGYFADPDGHLWEVAYNPFFPLASDGRVALA